MAPRNHSSPLPRRYLRPPPAHHPLEHQRLPNVADHHTAPPLPGPLNPAGQPTPAERWAPSDVAVAERVVHETRVIPGYTRRMKTAISIPDVPSHEAERPAAELGMSRSEFFTVAARRYIQELDAQSLTARIDAALAFAGSDETAQAAGHAGRRVLAAGDDW